MYVANFNYATDEQICRAVFLGLKLIDQGYPNEVGDQYFVTTDDMQSRGKALGGGTMPADAWADAHDRQRTEIWNRISSGHYTRDV
jgi:hypothetical protein